MTAADKRYHYTECGLDNVYLDNGFAFVTGPAGRSLVIKDIDGLHRAIGRALIDGKRLLSGRDIRFLRQEMLMSQAALAKLLRVSEQAVARWEKGKTSVPAPAEALIRLLYREHVGFGKEPPGIQRRLIRLAELADGIDGGELTMRRVANREWTATQLAFAA